MLVEIISAEILRGTPELWPLAKAWDIVFAEKPQGI
jgi:hypothetical protein